MSTFTNRLMEISVCNAVETPYAILYLTHSLQGSSLEVNICEPRGDGFSFCRHQLVPSFFFSSFFFCCCSSWIFQEKNTEFAMPLAPCWPSLSNFRSLNAQTLYFFNEFVKRSIYRLVPVNPCLHSKTRKKVSPARCIFLCLTIRSVWLMLSEAN